MKDDKPKNYAKGFWPREKVFQSGNTILSVSIDVPAFVEWLQSIAGADGKARIGISARREVSDKGITHTCWQDTWKPDRKDDAPHFRNEDHAAACPVARPADKPEATTDDLPF